MAGKINYVVSREHAYTIAPFIREEFPQLSNLITIRTYEQLLASQVVAPRLHIFTDFDRLDAADLTKAGRVADFLRRQLGDWAVVNHPAEVLDRFTLIEAMKAGGNQFSAYRVDELPAGISPRFPVFLRRARSHQGAMSRLLHDSTQLSETIALAAANMPLDDIRIVEFCDTREPGTGLYVKYSSHIIDGAIIPDHVIFSNRWMLRRSDVVNAELVERELDYVRTNPHEDDLRRVFGLAKIGYGRIDYSFAASDGSMQVWEINNNPDLSRPAQDSRMTAFGIVSTNIRNALLSLGDRQRAMA